MHYRYVMATDEITAETWALKYDVRGSTLRITGVAGPITPGSETYWIVARAPEALAAIDYDDENVKWAKRHADWGEPLAEYDDRPERPSSRVHVRLKEPEPEMPPPDPNREITPIGRLLRERRDALGLSAAALARLVGKSRAYVTLVENGQERLTNPETIDAFAEALGVSADQVYAAAGVIPADIGAAIIGLNAGDLARLRQFLERIVQEDRP
ncbi:MAG: helix-turn-helix transcriptional regulator [Thermomicrobiales bacterium]